MWMQRNLSDSVQILILETADIYSKRDTGNYKRQNNGKYVKTHSSGIYDVISRTVTFLRYFKEKYFSLIIETGIS